MIKSYGTLKCEPNFVYLECDPEIARMYRWFCRRKGIYLIRQRHDSHISVVRPEELSDFRFDKTHDGRVFEFVYNPEYIQKNATHYWFRVLSPELEDFRTGFGFCNQPAEIVNGKIVTHPFHLTIGRIAHTA